MRAKVPESYFRKRTATGYGLENCMKKSPSFCCTPYAEKISDRGIGRWDTEAAVAPRGFRIALNSRRLEGYPAVKRQDALDVALRPFTCAGAHKPSCGRV